MVYKQDKVQWSLELNDKNIAVIETKTNESLRNRLKLIFGCEKSKFGCEIQWIFLEKKKQDHELEIF